MQKRVLELESEATTLKASLAAREAEIDELKYGATRLLKQATAAQSDQEALAALNLLLSRHPAAPESIEATALLNSVQKRIAEAEQKKQQEEERKRQEARQALERALGNMTKKTDSIEDITWVNHKKSPSRGKFMTLYFGTKDDSARYYPLRMKVQYSGSEWLFVRSMVIKADDKRFDLDGLNFKRDHTSSTIWEWIDLPITDFAMLNAILDAKKVVIRFNGATYYDDFTLPQNLQQNMREVRTAWENMGGTP